MTEERPAYGGHRALFLECRRGSTGPVLVAQIECTDSTVPKNEQGCKSGTCPSHPTPRDSQSRVETNPHTVRPARSSVHTRAIIDHPLHTHTGAESPSPLPKPSHRNPPAPPLPSPANPPRRGPKWTLLPPATTTPTEAATSRLRQRASPNLGKARAPPPAASTKASHSTLAILGKPLMGVGMGRGLGQHPVATNLGISRKISLAGGIGGFTIPGKVWRTS